MNDSEILNFVIQSLEEVMSDIQLSGLESKIVCYSKAKSALIASKALTPSLMGASSSAKRESFSGLTENTVGNVAINHYARQVAVHIQMKDGTSRLVALFHANDQAIAYGKILAEFIGVPLEVNT